MKRLLFLSALVWILAGTLAAGTGSRVLAASGRNATTASLCAHEGYLRYVESDGTRFTNVDACVRYATQGEHIFPDASLTATFSTPARSGKSISTFLTLGGSGLQTGAPVLVQSVYRNGASESDSLVAVSSDGTFSSGVLYGCGYTKIVHIAVRTAYHTTIAVTRSLPC